MAARRTASFGRPYNYSNMQYPETLLPDSLHPIVELLNARLGIRFNNCLLNFYQTGDNSMGFHSDNTTGLVPGTGVAIVSLGSVRDITFRFKAEPRNESWLAPVHGRRSTARLDARHQKADRSRAQNQLDVASNRVSGTADISARSVGNSRLSNALPFPRTF
jgi:alkylated DNA repair dioxygenase AlkB